MELPNEPALIMKGEALSMLQAKAAVEGCIFDFDGVVVDTERFHYAAWDHAVHLVDIGLSWEEYLPLKSTSRPHILDFIQSKAGRLLSDDLRQQIIDAKVEKFDVLIRELSEKDIIPGVLTFIRQLVSRNIKLAVASSSTTAGAIAKDFGLNGYFDAIIDGNSSHPKKPAPDLFLAAAEALHCPPERCVVFEDSLAGIEAAVNAGMYVVAVGGIRSDNAVAHIEDFQQIWELFDEE